MSRQFQNKTILQILDKYKDLWALSHAGGVLGWDLETYMPEKGAGARGEAMGRLSTISQRLFLDPDFVNLIHKSQTEKGLTDTELGVVRVLTKDLGFYEKVSPKFLEDMALLTSRASIVWREAKTKNDFKLFEPYLTKVFDMNRELAEHLTYKDSPYDALLDQFEEGLTAERVESFFDEVREPLKALLTKITSSKKYFKVHPLVGLKYDKEKMAEFNTKVLKYLWPEFGNNFRLDTSAHPFTTSFSSSDTRITTWYHDTDFARSILAVIHEFGHALYDLQCDKGLEMTPIGGGSSLVIHESQSRFWENFVGRSEEFIKKFLSDMQKVVGKSITAPEVYSYFNKVSPGNLRVEADEVTYHFHIMLRFEIEKGVIEGSIKVKDIPEIWNAKMEEYLGITPKRDSDGSLQDIHWSMGSVGYFPTYSLGTFLGAEWEQQVESKKLGMSSESINNIETTLKNRIHKYGSTYTLEDLLKKNKMKFDPSVNLKYLTEKYSKIYGF